MNISRETFKIMLLRPAVYNGKEIEIDVKFTNSSLYRIDYSTAKAIDMTLGDTVGINGRVCTSDKDALCEFITIFIDGDELTKFIEKFGFKDISATLTLKAQFVYAVHNTKDYYERETAEETIGCKLLEIIDKNNNIKNTEMRDYFMDGMK